MPSVPGDSASDDAPELIADRMVVGGDALAHGEDGRIVFVAGALPGEKVRVRIRESRERLAFADLLEVTGPSPHRVPPPCPHVSAGCGGCDWLHVEPDQQRQLRVEIIADAFSHNAGLTVPPISVIELPAHSYRTTVRVAAGPDGPGFHARRSEHVVAVDSCLVAHPLAEELLVEGDFGSADDAMIRVGANTGERMVVGGPTAEGVSMPPDVMVVGRDELATGRRAWIHEEIDGHLYRVSADSFFQASASGAAALVGCVTAALRGVDGPVLDAYAGVGLLSKPLVTTHVVTAVERSSSATADARANLGPRARVIRSAFERWRPRRMAAVIADPSRRGLGRTGADRIVAAGPGRVVLVSCDVAAAARDVAMLGERDFAVESMTLVDQFSGTSHLELVTVLDRLRR